MTNRDFVKRCRALGCPNFHAAAHRLQLPPSSVYRLWAGERKVSARVQERLEAVEREQPVKPLTPLMAKLLLTWPNVPAARSNFEKGIDWVAVADEAEESGLVRGVAFPTPPTFTPLGARTAAWLRERDDARMES